MKFDYSDKPTKNKMHPKDKKALIIGAVCLAAIFAFGGAFAIYMHGVNFPTTPAQPVVTDNSTAADAVVPEPTIPEPTVVISATQPEASVNNDELLKLYEQECELFEDLNNDGFIGEHFPVDAPIYVDLNEPEPQPTQPAPSGEPSVPSGGVQSIISDGPHQVDGSDGYTGDRSLMGTGEQVGHM